MTTLHIVIETIMTSRIVNAKKFGKTHAPHLDTETVRSFGNNMTDVITALNCIYVAEWTACEWVELLTLKKDVHVRLAIEMIEKVK